MIKAAEIARIQFLGSRMYHPSQTLAGLEADIMCREHHDGDNVSISLQVCDADTKEPLSEEHFVSSSFEEACNSALTEAISNLEKSGWTRVGAYMG